MSKVTADICITVLVLPSGAAAITRPLLAPIERSSVIRSSREKITTTTQAQSTGLDWGLQLESSRIEFLNGVAAVGVDVEHARSSATEFAIDGGTVFEGATAKAGIYIRLGNVSARVDVGRVIFRGSPAQATRGQTGTLSLHGCRFETTGGQSAASPPLTKDIVAVSGL